MASARPGASRSSTAAVPSGVRSRGPKPVPPVVTTRPAKPSVRRRRAAATESAPSATTRCSTTSKPAADSRSTRAAPDRSSRVPGDHPVGHGQHLGLEVIDEADPIVRCRPRRSGPRGARRPAGGGRRCARRWPAGGPCPRAAPRPGPSALPRRCRPPGWPGRARPRPAGDPGRPGPRGPGARAGGGRGTSSTPGPGGRPGGGAPPAASSRGGAPRARSWPRRSASPTWGGGLGQAARRAGDQQLRPHRPTGPTAARRGCRPAPIGRSTQA